MVMPPSLTPAQYPAYLKALHTQSAQRTTFTMLDLSHRILHEVHPVAIDGQVDTNDDGTDVAGVLRRVQAGFLDPGFALGLDTGSPADGAVGADRLLRVTVSNYVDSLDRWVDMNVFTGRCSVVGRDGDRLALQAQDKACLWLRNGPSGHIPKGTRVIKGIYDAMYKAGERFFRFPPFDSVKDRITHHVPYGGPNDDMQEWKVYRRIARRSGLQLFYDGSGYATLRPYPTAKMVTFDASQLTTNVQTETDLTTFHNRVVAHGHKKQVATVNAAKSHPLSASNLAVNGVPWVNILHISAPHLRGNALHRHAQRALDKALTEVTTVRMSVVPMPIFDPLDWCGLLLKGGSMGFSMHESSLPLGDGGDMSIGSQKRVRRSSAGRVGVAL